MASDKFFGNPLIIAAEGYHDLGMHEDAWNVLEELPPIDKTEPLVLELRLRILTAMNRWELGDHIANVLIGSMIEPEKCRETVARFRHAHARALSLQGDREGSRKQIAAAVDAWPWIRADLVNDDDLASLWVE